jgi:hypothetical protein
METDKQMTAGAMGPGGGRGVIPPKREGGGGCRGQIDRVEILDGQQQKKKLQDLLFFEKLKFLEKVKRKKMFLKSFF